ncbi:MAG: P-loop NTPase family protein [Anaerolineae bacterium]
MSEKLTETISTIRSRYGDRAVRTLADLRRIDPEQVLSTGWPALDKALGIGGLPRGRIAEIIAQGTAGQGALLANLLGEAQRRRLSTAYLDAEGAIDLELLHARGVVLEALVVLQPAGWLHGLQMTRDLLLAGGVGLVVLDRLPLWQPDLPDTEALERLLRDVTGLVARSQTTLVILTELADEAAYPAGLALRYAASVRLTLTWQRWLVLHGITQGLVTQAAVLKNKVAAPGGVAEISVWLPAPHRGDHEADCVPTCVDRVE